MRRRRLEKSMTPLLHTNRTTRDENVRASVTYFLFGRWTRCEISPINQSMDWWTWWMGRWLAKSVSQSEDRHAKSRKPTLYPPIHTANHKPARNLPPEALSKGQPRSLRLIPYIHTFGLMSSDAKKHIRDNLIKQTCVGYSPLHCPN